MCEICLTSVCMSSVFVGFARSKSSFQSFGTRPGRMHAEAGGFDHMSERARGQFLVRKELHDQFQIDTPPRPVNSLLWSSKKISYIYVCVLDLPVVFMYVLCMQYIPSCDYVRNPFLNEEKVLLCWKWAIKQLLYETSLHTLNLSVKIKAFESHWHLLHDSILINLTKTWKLW